MDERELREIWERVMIKSRGIVTLRPYRQTEVQTRPDLFVSNTLAEVREGPLDIPGLLFGRLSKEDRQKHLAIISNVNGKLLSVPRKEKEIHDRLEHDLVAEELRKPLAAVRGRGSKPDQYVVFTRRSLLLLAKITLGINHADSSLDFEEKSTGELMLATNELFEHQNASVTDDGLMLESLASWDLYNADEEWVQIARFDFLMSDLFGNDLNIVEMLKKFEFSATPFDGLSFDQYRALVFVTYAMISDVVGKGEAPVLDVQPPVPRFLGSDETVRAALDLRSWPINDFVDPTFGGKWDEGSLHNLLNQGRFIHDNVWIRQKPFVRLTDGRYLLPDYRVAVTRMTSGMFWTLFDNLPQGKLREDFFALWGVVFERYIRQLLLFFYPDAGSVLAKNLYTNLPFKFDGTAGEIDALLDFGHHVILFEVKASPLPLPERTSRDIGLLDKWVQHRLIRTKDGEKKALVQLVDAARAIVRGAALKRTDGLASIYPTLITDEVAFEAFGVNRYLAAKFESLLDEELRKMVKPLTVISTGELEEALPYFREGIVSWRPILESRFERRAVKWESFGQAMYNTLLSEGRIQGKKRNEFLGDRFDKFVGELRDTMKTEAARVASGASS